MIELNGIIEEGWEYGEIYIGDQCLAYEVSDLDGEIAKLRYYLSDAPINKETVVANFLSAFYEGATEADGSYVCGSSWRGVYAKKDELQVGGHDIIKELSSHLGKYCYLIIETL